MLQSKGRRARSSLPQPRRVMLLCFRPTALAVAPCCCHARAWRGASTSHAHIRHHPVSRICDGALRVVVGVVDEYAVGQLQLTRGQGRAHVPAEPALLRSRGPGRGRTCTPRVTIGPRAGVLRCAGEPRATPARPRRTRRCTRVRYRGWGGRSKAMPPLAASAARCSAIMDIAESGRNW